LPLALASEAAMDLQRDREGGIWIAQLGGLAHLRPNWRNFTLLQPRAALLTSAAADSLSALAACPRRHGVAHDRGRRPGALRSRHRRIRAAPAGTRAARGAALRRATGPAACQGPGRCGSDTEKG
jgi:hypothetical protein